ncbi:MULTISPECIES: hypothetical protein [unclassified Microbacterium]|uniref:hypothetical protein n=1 Tax=unclassified Microbacterium TaxID=2609290 RepID=UPI00301A16CE
MTHRSEPNTTCSICNGMGFVVVTRDPDTDAECVCINPMDYPRLTPHARHLIRREVASLVLAAMGSAVGQLPELMASGRMRADDFSTTLAEIFTPEAAEFMQWRGDIALDMVFADIAAEVP